MEEIVFLCFLMLFVSQKVAMVKFGSIPSSPVVLFTGQLSGGMFLPSLIRPRSKILIFSEELSSGKEGRQRVFVFP